MLKQMLSNPPLLQYPNFVKPFKLTTDASDHAVGAVVSLSSETEELPIAYAIKQRDIKCDRKKKTLKIAWAC